MYSPNESTAKIYKLGQPFPFDVAFARVPLTGFQCLQGSEQKKTKMHTVAKTRQKTSTVEEKKRKEKRNIILTIIDAFARIK